jgi:hypothetical protein
MTTDSDRICKQCLFQAMEAEWDTSSESSLMEEISHAIKMYRRGGCGRYGNTRRGHKRCIYAAEHAVIK